MNAKAAAIPQPLGKWNLGQKRAALATWARGQHLGRRFWQARAVESFLRGTTSYADQMFLLKRGLLEVMAWRVRVLGVPFSRSPCVLPCPETWAAGRNIWVACKVPEQMPWYVP